ncbi:outer membrane protein assembly factor BamD [mine drainage metagenome]|uniref:Outer membrane protein assembly factor BamD n=1 Tax=mine drainage metagenome TaxID=410659 RepID=A0A1J5SMT2_9ZZZZ
MRPRFFVCLLAVVSPLVAAEAPLFPPAPLSSAGAVARSAHTPGELLAAETAADRALALGLPSVASDLYLRLLAPGSGFDGDRSALRLSCATALMEYGRLDEAQRVLDAETGPRGPAWKLRAALIAANDRRIEQARREIADVRVDQLPGQDRGWWYFLQGMLADAANKFDQSRDFYAQAIQHAATELARVRFDLAREQAFLRRGEVNLDALRANAERFQGQKVGYGAIKQYAIGLYATGHQGEAVGQLQRLLQSLPHVEVNEVDEVRLLLGMIDGATQGSAGRDALFRLLENGHDAGRQRIALMLLAQASTQGVAADEFRSRLDRMIATQPPHPILDYLLLARAESALLAKDFAQAEDDARSLLDRFPGSQLRAYALGVLTNATWEQRRYRTAADYAEKARAVLPPGPARSQLGVVVAEAWYRAGDYRSAADAYAAALRELPPDVAPGQVMFQRVESEIDAGRLDQARTLLDGFARNPSFDIDDRWQAEWNLARSLEAAGRQADALSRVAALLAPGAPLPNDASLRARMAWLRARLSLDAGKPAEAFKLASGLVPGLEGIAPDLKSTIASSAALIAAQAEFALNRPDDALAALKKLRADFPHSDAAVYSMIAEADYFLSKDRSVDAQQRLVQLADEYKDSPYAPYALYRAALLAERRGQDASFQDANRLIEQLVSRYPTSDLVFYARLKQGDLLRKLNEFDLAQRAYEYLVRNYPQHRDIPAVLLSLADCHAAQAGTNPEHAARALEIYEGLISRPDASADMRVEAGYKLGAAYRRRGDLKRATEVWWQDVVSAFLVNPAHAASLGARGRSWMARTLFDLADLLERQGKPDEARRALTLVMNSKLSTASVELARAKIAQASGNPRP